MQQQRSAAFFRGIHPTARRERKTCFPPNAAVSAALSCLVKKFNGNSLQLRVRGRLPFNAVLNTVLTAHGRRCRPSIPKRWSTLALPNYFPCALTCVSPPNNLKRSDVIVCHVQSLKGTFLRAPRTICSRHYHAEPANTNGFYDPRSRPDHAVGSQSWGKGGTAPGTEPLRRTLPGVKQRSCSVAVFGAPSFHCSPGSVGPSSL